MGRFEQRRLCAADYQGLRTITGDSGRESRFLPTPSTHGGMLGFEALFLGAVSLAPTESEVS